MSRYSEEHKARHWNQKGLDVAYTEGFATGQNWESPWVPGGPRVNRPEPHDEIRDPEWFAYCQHTLAYNERWLQGWRDGLANK